MPLRERRSDTERIQQLEVHATGRVERRLDEPLEYLEAAGAPRLCVPLFAAQRQAGADREDLGTEPEQGAGIVGDERPHVFQLARILEDVDLVDDDDDLLAPA